MVYYHARFSLIWSERTYCLNYMIKLVVVKLFYLHTKAKSPNQISEYSWPAYCIISHVLEYRTAQVKPDLNIDIE